MNTQILELADAIEATFNRNHEWGAEFEAFEVSTDRFIADVVYEARFGCAEGAMPYDSTIVLEDSKLYVTNIYYAGDRWKNEPIPSREDILTCINTLLEV